MKNIVLIVVMLFACLKVSAQQATEFSAETLVATTESYGTADDSLLRASKGRLYLGTERLDRKDLQSLFVSEPNLYFRYKDALRWRKLSWTPFVASLVPALALWTYGGLAGPEDGSMFFGGLLFVTTGATGTALMCWKCNKDLKAIAYDYNDKVLRGRETARELSFVATGGGLGLRFSF